jgi:hypothetical protein
MITKDKHEVLKITNQIAPKFKTVPEPKTLDLHLVASVPYTLFLA